MCVDCAGAWFARELKSGRARRVSDKDRELAFANIKKATEYYGIDMNETGWSQLGRTPHTGRTAEDRRESAREAAVTRKRERLGK